MLAVFVSCAVLACDFPLALLGWIDRETVVAKKRRLGSCMIWLGLNDVG